MRPPVQLEKLESLMVAMGRRVKTGLITRELLWQQFLRIESRLIRYPALDPKSFRSVVEAFCQTPH